MRAVLTKRLPLDFLTHLLDSYVINLKRYTDFVIIEKRKSYMQQLSQNDYAHINGGFGLPGAGFGGALGGLSYLGSAATSGSFSWSGLGSAVIVGAASGAVGGPVGNAVVKYGLSKVSFYGGAVQGVINE